MIEQIFRNRIDAVRHTLFADLRLDLLLAYCDDPQHAGAVRYLSDFDIYAMYALVVVPIRGDVALAFGLHHSAYLVRAKESANADYFLGTYQPGELCRTLLEESGQPTASARLGVIGGSSMFRRIEDNLRATFPDATFVDADTAFRSAIEGDSALSKQDALTRLQRSGAITRDGVEIALQRWRRGCSASEVAADIGRAARRRGTDILNREMVRVAFASGTPLPRYLDRDASNVALSPDALTVEVSAVYGGMNTSATRTFAANDTDADLGQYRDAHHVLCRSLKTGITVDSVLDAAVERGLRISNDLSDELGAGIGFSTREPPMLCRGNGGALPDMSAIHLVSRAHSSRLGNIRFADTVLVTRAGGQILTEAAKA